MKITLVLLVVLGVVGEARAQGGVPVGFDSGLISAIAAADLSVGVLGLVYGAGSSRTLARGTISKHWFAGSYTAAALNLALGAAWAGLAIDDRGRSSAMVALAIGHLTVGLWNAIIPSIALATVDSYSGPKPLMSPVMITGRGASGRRFSGLAVQVTNF